MKAVRVLIILVLCNSLIQLPCYAIAQSNQTRLFEDAKTQISFLLNGNIISKNTDLNAKLTKKEFVKWLQFLTYDANKNLLSNSSLSNQKIKQNMTKLNLLTTYEKWETSNSLNKQINKQEMFSILYQLLGYGNLEVKQINQLNEVKTLISAEEAKNTNENSVLTTKVGAVIFGRFLKQFQSSINYTTNHVYTSDKSLFINEGLTSKYKHIIEIPKKKSFYIVSKYGNIPIAMYNGKIGYLTKDISSTFPQVKNLNYVVKANKVNVRLGPSTNYPIVRNVNLNEKLVGFPFNSEWIEIKVDKRRSFISSSYVKQSNTVQNIHHNQNVTDILVKKVYVLADKLNIREEQSINSRKIGTVFKGETLEVIAKFSNWTKVKYKNIIGYVSNEYISEDLASIEKNIVIAVDAGHGGKDSGTHFNQLNEKDITLATALEIKQSFNQSNVKVVLTRESDVFVELGKRVSIAKSNDAILFVSIHVNSGSGSETYYYGEMGKNPYISQSQSLAKSIQSEMVNAWHLTDRGIHHGNFQVIRDNSMPAVLSELGFIDSKKDQSYLSSSQQIKIISCAIHDGISFYLNSQGYKINNR